MRHDCARSYERIMSDRNARTDRGTGADPSVILDRRWQVDGIVQIFAAMIRCQYHSARTDP